MDRTPSRRRVSGRGYTLLEVLVVVTVLGIAAALIVPSMGSTGILRVHTALRTMVADVTFAQADALAYQQRRAIMFDVPNNKYMLLEVNGPVLDPSADIMYDPARPGKRFEVSFNDPRFAGAKLTTVDFEGGDTLIFDELGGPVRTPTGEEPSAGGRVVIEGQGRLFELDVEAYTGRLTTNEYPVP
jgi:prepilin-type N-terminal cleavage/methylation domain-containing protein